jgi:hypothetical protein
VTEVSYLRKMTNCGRRDLAGDPPARRYRIIVSGRLGMIGCEAFRDLQIEPHGTDTALTGDLTRSGLHDALTLIRDLALDLVGFTCLAPELIVPMSSTCGSDVDQSSTRTTIQADSEAVGLILPLQRRSTPPLAAHRWGSDAACRCLRRAWMRSWTVPATGPGWSMEPATSCGIPA